MLEPNILPEREVLQYHRSSDSQCRHTMGVYANAVNYEGIPPMFTGTMNQCCHDPLTGLDNWTGFTQQAEAILNFANRKNHYYLVYFNISDFSRTVAMNGVERGDASLIEFGVFLRHVCSEREVCARIFKGDFICLVRGESAEEVSSRFQMKNQSSQDLTFFPPHYFRYGVYAVPQRHAGVRQMSEYAIYACDCVGKNNQQNFALFDETMDRQYRRQQSFLQCFSMNLLSESFPVYYQPQVDIKSGKIIACEALARWITPEGEVVSPGEFMDLLEKYDLISILDLYMLKRVCQFIRYRLDRELPIVPVSVNFSHLHMFSSELVSHICKTLHGYGIDPSYIELEITESAFLHSEESIFESIATLRKCGFRIAIDDFGKACSSFKVLRKMAVDVIKLDKSFFAPSADVEKEKIIIEGILAIAGKLGIETVSEGVETEAIAKYLRKKGCTRIQGFYYYTPLEEQAWGYLLDSIKK